MTATGQPKRKCAGAFGFHFRHAVRLEDRRPMRVLFDHGTIVLAETPDLNLGFLPSRQEFTAIARGSPEGRAADVLAIVEGRAASDALKHSGGP